MSCKNCGADLNGPYCSQCGQKRIDGRITVKDMISQLFLTLTNVERGFLYTTRQLFVAPGKAIREYLSGATRKYYHPLRFFFIWMGAVVIIGLWLGFYDAQNENMSQWNFGPQDPDTIARQKKIMEWTKKFLNIIPLFLIPFQSLISKRLFRKSGFNYAENLVINTFLYGQLALIGLIPLILYMAIPVLLPWAFVISLMISSLYYGYAFRNLFSVSTSMALFKAFLVNVGGFILFMISIFIVTILAVTVFIIIKKMFG